MNLSTGTRRNQSTWLLIDRHLLAFFPSPNPLVRTRCTIATRTLTSSTPFTPPLSPSLVQLSLSRSPKRPLARASKQARKGILGPVLVRCTNRRAGLVPFLR